jgi:hypothetical protein
MGVARPRSRLLDHCGDLRLCSAWRLRTGPCRLRATYSRPSVCLAALAAVARSSRSVAAGFLQHPVFVSERTESLRLGRIPAEARSLHALVSLLPTHVNTHTFSFDATDFHVVEQSAIRYHVARESMLCCAGRADQRERPSAILSDGPIERRHSSFAA